MPQQYRAAEICMRDWGGKHLPCRLGGWLALSLGCQIGLILKTVFRGPLVLYLISVCVKGYFGRDPNDLLRGLSPESPLPILHLEFI